jgi:drug/metabolite transporter (DMT)-like permease
MGIALSLLTALIYGAADFCGGFASKRAPVFVVLIVSQATGLVLVACIVPFLPEVWRLGDLGNGALAGIAGGIAVGLLYRGLSIGTMGVVSPITAVFAASVPVAFGVLVRGERPALLETIGIVCALVAVVFVSLADEAADHDRDRTRRGLPPGLLEALGAGVFFGVFFVFLARVPADAGLAPLVGARLASVPLFILAALIGKQPILPTRANLGTIALAGALDMLANVTFVLAAHTGTLLAIVSVLSSLYPATTVVLAAVVLHERLNRSQWVGVAFALVGVGLIASSH